MQFLSHLLVFGTLFSLYLAENEIHNLAHALSEGGGNEKASTLSDELKDFINKPKNLYPYYGGPQGPDTESPKDVEKPMDCSDILRSGKNESGVYVIWPRSRIFTNRSLDVYCDMDTDGGGWTVIQRRGNFSTPKDYFYKDWESYKNGFGNLTEEFWIGNDNIFAISNQAVYTIHFDLKAADGETGYAEYNTFWIGDEISNYTLQIDGYKGNVGNAMVINDGVKFSTKDRDNDEWIEGSCAVDRQGGWWYSVCANANLNGLYQPGIESEKGCTWWNWDASHWVGLSGVEIKIRS